jgi:hypothetical protein
MQRHKEVQKRDLAQHLRSVELLELSQHPDVIGGHKVDCHLLASKLSCYTYKSAVFNTEGRC